jgi:FkbM family methyltransferase
MNQNQSEPGRHVEFEKSSFSQCGEDLIIAYVFALRGVTHPTYVDVGAHHPWWINNTALFYRKGCRGINIEPNPSLMEAFRKERPQDINLDVGVGSEPGRLELYVLEDTSLSTFSKPQLDDFVSKGHQLKQTLTIQIWTLTEVIGRYAGSKFPDLLNLDTEGFETEVLSGVDLSKSRPKIICVETAEYSTTGAGAKRKDLMQYVESRGYYLYADTNLNSIYVDQTFWFG